MSDQIGEWHFVEVYEDPDGEEVDEACMSANIIHPESCGTRITLGYLPNGSPWVERLCGFDYEAENVGRMESLGRPEPGWYAARHWREERSTMHSVWAEVTTGIEVLPFTPPWLTTTAKAS